jgi:hypothetical protein
VTSHDSDEALPATQEPVTAPPSLAPLATIFGERFTLSTRRCSLATVRKDANAHANDRDGLVRSVQAKQTPTD